MKKAFITGITGQDGAYLAKLLLERGYKVYGGVRRSSTPNFWRLKELGIENEVELVEFELNDLALILSIISKIRPNEIYNLAAQSFVEASFNEPIYTQNVNSIGTLNLLEAIRLIDKNIKFYQASTSEMFGMSKEIPQKETTPFYPRSPYAISKLSAHWLAINYKESYDIFATCGILFNHESPLRGEEFVTRKISKGVAEIFCKKREFIELGNLDAKRDWGYAREYVEGMYLMMQKDIADVYILATNTTHSVRDFVKEAFKVIGEEIEFKGTKEREIGVNRDGVIRVKVNPKYFRPAEVEILRGDYSKAKKELNWSPKVTFKELVELMVKADIKRCK